MNAPTDIQIINDTAGKPAFVVMPYEQYLAEHPDESLIPHAVVELMIDDDVTLMTAWRRYLGLTQSETAERIGISQAAYAQFERSDKPRRVTLEKVARAFGVSSEQLSDA
jgi:DNA-binding XRE family transcriptional regulator